MSRPALRRRLSILLVSVAVLATACLNNIGDPENPNVLSMGMPTPTATPIPPTATETPTPEIISELPTLSDIELLQLTLDAQAASDQLLSDTGGAFGTETPTPLVIAQNNDPFEQTATVYVAQVTQTQESSLTQTAIALGIGSTATPVFPTPTLPGAFATTDPFATQIVQPPVGQVCIHTVQGGDNLFRLSLTYGVSVNQLAATNGITNIQLIVVGQQITIPGCGTTGVFPPATPIPAFSSGTGGFGTPSAIGTLPSQSVTTCNTHLVQQYETLFQISLTYGVSMGNIQTLNGITNPNFIVMGTTLNIPCA